MRQELQVAACIFYLFIPQAVRAMGGGMKHLLPALLVTTALSLSACSEMGYMGNQLFNPDTTFAAADQPAIKGINDTQEDMAKEAMHQGDFGRAAQFYKQLIGSEKGTPEQQLRYRLGMAEAARRLGDFEAALRMYQDLRGKQPGNVEIGEGLGLTLMASGKTTDAAQIFAEVLEKDHKRWRTLNALGILFVGKNMLPEALAYFTEAMSHSPDNPAILNNSGLTFAVDRNFPRAIDALQQAARASKSPLQRKQVELNLALIYGVSGDFDAAREVAGRHLEGPALENNLGLYAHLAKDDALAKSYLNMALTQSSTYYERAWENLDLLNNAGRSDSKN
jgi:Flp pilus assembly protein TadD